MEIENYFIAAGLNSIGILTGGGVGKAMAKWIADGKPDVDVTGVNVTRFQDFQSNELYRRDRSEEVRVSAGHFC